jgi:hypothetical protein
VRLGEDKAHASGELSDSKLLTERIPICDLHMRERERERGSTGHRYEVLLRPRKSVTREARL